MRRLILAAGCALLPLAASQANASLNITLTGNYWNASPSGSIQGNSTEQPLDVERQLGLSSEGMNNVAVQFDHFIPVVPNFRLTQTQLDFSGRSSEEVTFKGQQFTGEVQSQVDLSHTDITAYYRLLDNLTAFVPLVSLRLELGLTARIFDGGFEVRSGQAASSEDLSLPVPMGYVGGLVSLPKGVSVGARMNYMSFSDSSLSDLKVFANYEYDGLPLITPGLTLGYRQFSLDLDDLDDSYGDLTLKGPHLGAYLRVGF